MMKSQGLWFAALLAAAGTVLPGDDCSAGNLMRDPSFEQYTTQGAKSPWNGPAGGAVKVDSSAVHGQYLCRIDNSAGGTISQKVKVQAGTEYIALAWIRTGVFLEAGHFTVQYGEGKESSILVTNDIWHLYGIPFTAEADSVEIAWEMGANTGGSWCDMFCLTVFESYISDSGMEFEFPDFEAFGGWKWGAEITDEMPHTGDYAWTSDPAGGGGFGIYPEFEEKDIIIAGAWIKTGENSFFPTRDHDGWTNLGWWAVRKAQHVSEINIENIDIEYSQFVIPYKVPPDGIKPEVLWWQDSGETPSYCDDIFIIKSPYTDEQIPWEMMVSSYPDWGFWPNPEDETWPVTPASTENFITGGGFEDASDWTVFDMASTDPAAVEFNYTADRPAAGSGGCLHVSGASTNSNVLVYQELTLKAGVTYELTGAFKDLGGDNGNGFWSQLYMSTEPPVEGVDWKPPAGANTDYNLGFNSWSGCSGAGVDGTFQDNGCDGKNTRFYTAPGEAGRDVIAYFGVKTGVWSGTDPLSYNVLIDDVKLIPATNGIEEERTVKIGSYRLEQNYPNPFNPATRIGYSLAGTANVEIAVYDMRGRRIKILLDGVGTAGFHEIQWNGTDLSGNAVPAGIYLCKMRVSGNGREYAATRKMVLMK